MGCLEGLIQTREGKSLFLDNISHEKWKYNFWVKHAELRDDYLDRNLSLHKPRWLFNLSLLFFTEYMYNETEQEQAGKLRFSHIY